MTNRWASRLALVGLFAAAEMICAGRFSALAQSPKQPPKPFAANSKSLAENLVPIRSVHEPPGHLMDYVIPSGQEPAITPPGSTPVQSPASEQLPAPRTEKSIEPSTDFPIRHQDSNSSDGRPVIETSGRVEVIKQHYSDGKVQIEREVTQDLAGNYFNHGYWRLYGPAGQNLAEGVFQFGLMDGPWSRWHPAQPTGIFTLKPFNQFRGPFLSTATFRDGKLDGVWAISDSSQRKIMEMSYRQGKRHGISAWYYPNSARMREQYFVQGVLDGPLVEWDERGTETRREEYQKGHRVLTETEYFRKNQKRSVVNYLDSRLELKGDDDWWEALPAPYQAVGEKVRNGPCGTWYENGQPQMQGQFTDGQRTGPWTWWHSNGQKQLAGQFENGEKVGPWTWWHSNGMKAAEGNFQHDEPAGIWTWWNELGQKSDEKHFVLEDDDQSQPEITEPGVDDTSEQSGTDKSSVQHEVNSLPSDTDKKADAEDKSTVAPMLNSPNLNQPVPNLDTSPNHKGDNPGTDSDKTSGKDSIEEIPSELPNEGPPGKSDG